MNAVRKIHELNRQELENNVSDAASWHADYSDTSYIYIGGFPKDLDEMDVLIVFSEFGNPTHLHLIRDQETGESRGFAYLKYEDQRSCVLAVDNFNGIKMFDSFLRVDHTYYRLKEGQNEDDFKVSYADAIVEKNTKLVESTKADKRKPRLLEYKPNDEQKEQEEEEDDFKDPMEGFKDESLQKNDEFEDPMAAYLEKGAGDRKRRKHGKDSHRHRRSHRSREAEKEGSTK